jgi:hypothetical protein
VIAKSLEFAETQGHEEIGDPCHSMSGRDQRADPLTFGKKAKREMQFVEKTKRARKPAS